VRLEQFGSPQGGVVNSGVSVEVATLAFLAVFGIGCGVTLFTARVIRGYRVAALAERAAS
jgi:hypothetical protein